VSEKPTDPAELDDIGDRYRHDSASDAGRPAATVRAAVLAHAAQLAAKRQADRAAAVPPRRATPRRFRPVLFGSLAAAAFAGVLMTPYLFTIEPPTPTTTPTPKTSISSENPAVASRETPRAPAEPPVAPAEPPVAIGPSSADSQAAPNVRRNTNEAAAPIGGLPSAPAAPAAESRFATARAAKPSESSADAGAVMRGPIPGDALQSAARTGDLPTLQVLLEQHADLEARDADGRTALMLAVTHGQLAAAEALLARGADPNAADAHGVTPLQAALAARQPAIASALERAGAQ
jgi:hypothetical protein